MISLFAILLTIQVLICVCMGGLILIQRSEGGALGMGGGPSGFMSARGTGNLLTTATAWFAFFFFANSIALTVVGNLQNHVKSAVDTVDTSKLTLTPQEQAQQSADAAAAAAGGSSSSSLGALPLSNLPLAGQVPAQTAPAPTVTVAAPPSHSSAAPSSQAPAPLPAKLPTLTAGSASSLTAQQAAKAKASVFGPASSSSASKAAPSSGAATPPASSSSTTPQ